MIDPDKEIEQSKVLLERRRLVIISNALREMESNAQKYLEAFSQCEDYRLFRTAFRQYKFDTKLQNIVDFQLCDNAQSENSYYKQVNKKIILCYNKISDQKHFNQILKQNLVYLYDDLRANINWYDCSMLACMKIRGLNLSGKCHKSNKQCFVEEVKGSLEKSEVCKGKFNEYFEDTYKQCILDISPVNSLQQTKHTIFF